MSVPLIAMVLLKEPLSFDERNARGVIESFPSTATLGITKDERLLAAYDIGQKSMKLVLRDPQED